MVPALSGRSLENLVALAHKLNPPRRIAFALAILSLLIGWFEFILFGTNGAAEGRSSGAFWLAVSFIVIVILLFMELRDKLDLKGDLEIAREIQFGLVPSEPFHQDGISICYSMRPANFDPISDKTAFPCILHPAEVIGLAISILGFSAELNARGWIGNFGVTKCFDILSVF